MAREDKKTRVQQGLNKLIENYVRLTRVYVAMACSGMPCVPRGVSEDDAVDLANQHRGRLIDAWAAMNSARFSAEREYSYWLGPEYVPEPLDEHIRRVRERVCEPEVVV